MKTKSRTSSFLRRLQHTRFTSLIAAVSFSMTLWLNIVPWSNHLLFADHHEVREESYDDYEGTPPTTNEMATAIMTAETAEFLTNATFSGADVQAAVLSDPVQGFPTDNGAYLVLSSGIAALTPGVAMQFVSNSVGGPSLGANAPQSSPDGLVSNDVATLRLTFDLPASVQSLKFDWKFGTEENPDFTFSFPDYFRADVFTPDGAVTNIAVLPNGNPVTVTNARLFSNAVTGSSTNPSPPFPEPNDVVYNAVTTDIQTASIELDEFTGQTVTIQFRVADVNDIILNSAVILDNLRIETSPQTLQDKAVELAKTVESGDYLWGGKGWDYSIKQYATSEVIRNGKYTYYRPEKDAFGKDDPNGGKLDENGAGLDCSGLILWSYNKAAGASNFVPNEVPCSTPICYEGAHSQCSDNNSQDVSETDLKPGDLLCFDRDQNNHIDHVAMYIGNNEIIEAFGFEAGIRLAKKSDRTNPNTGFVEFRRIKAPKVEVLIKTGSPVSLIVTDPDGFTIDSETFIITDLEYLREIPGTLYYSQLEIGEDGRLNDVVYSPTLKKGDYIIQVIPKPDASPTDTYSLEIETAGTTIILAQDVIIREIPPLGYGIEVANGEVVPFIPIVIDIHPDSDQNPINPNSKGIIPVAILTTNGFDATTVDPSSVRFGPNGARETHNRGHIEDVDGDGDDDMVLHFRTEETGFKEGDTQGMITGRTLSGMNIKGSDSIRIVP